MLRYETTRSAASDTAAASNGNSSDDGDGDSTYEDASDNESASDSSEMSGLSDGASDSDGNADESDDADDYGESMSMPFDQRQTRRDERLRALSDAELAAEDADAKRVLAVLRAQITRRQLRIPERCVEMANAEAHAAAVEREKADRELAAAEKEAEACAANYARVFGHARVRR